MIFHDNDFVVLSSAFVGSKMSGVLPTPVERSKYRDDGEPDHYYGSQSLQDSQSKYERYYRPTLKLFKKREKAEENPDRYGSHAGDAVTFILPLAKSDQPTPSSSMSSSADSQMFHGRPVAAHVNLQQVQQWFQTCSGGHPGAKLRNPPERGRLRSGELESGDDWCLPSPRRKIPHFRLIDVQGQCVVVARDHDNYAALSYVWGCAKRLLLTAETLKQLSTPGALSRDKEEVPRTFKDALSVAKQLDIAFVWIDALCVMQDDQDKLVQHMNAMDAIYSSAILTIVSDAASADTGIPGISVPRGPPQAILKHGSKSYISAKRTFGQALTSDSFWESRAWCLQEKLFSPRLLVFTGHQAFYHCAATTWFEDTIMEPREQDRITAISIAEWSGPLFKHSKGGPPPEHTAYEAHRKLFEHNFLPLLEIYTRRQLSFESDAIRAFSGILSSMESEHGPALWGVPEYYFARVITWSQSRHKMDARRPQFPSWSWAGWRGNTGSTIHFGKVLNDTSDEWKIDWHFHKFNKQTRIYELTPMQHRPQSFFSTMREDEVEIRRPKHKRGQRPETPKFELPKASSPLSEPSSYFDNEHPVGNYNWLHRIRNRMVRIRDRNRMDHIWGLPGHPDEPDYVDLEMPAFTHDPTRMPPPSHIIRFFTSCARVFIDAESDLEYTENYYQEYGPADKDQCETFYGIRSVSSKRQIFGHIPLDPAWEGKGKEHELVYISRSFRRPTDDWSEPGPVIIWVMLVEDLEGAPEVKSRVSMYGPMDISSWRMAKPEWKCVTLA
jgi:hypothetical protein